VNDKGLQVAPVFSLHIRGRCRPQAAEEVNAKYNMNRKNTAEGFNPRRCFLLVAVKADMLKIK